MANYWLLIYELPCDYLVFVEAIRILLRQNRELAGVLFEGEKNVPVSGRQVNCKKVVQVCKNSQERLTNLLAPSDRANACVTRDSASFEFFIWRSCELNSLLRGKFPQCEHRKRTVKNG